MLQLTTKINKQTKERSRRDCRSTTPDLNPILQLLVKEMMPVTRLNHGAGNDRRKKKCWKLMSPSLALLLFLLLFRTPRALSSAKICWSYVVHLNVSASSNSQSYVLAASFVCLFSFVTFVRHPSYVRLFFFPSLSQRLVSAYKYYIYFIYTYK